jgi:predicted nucleotidyltransferase
LRDHKARFVDQYGIISLGVFGSVARGEVRDDSDIDIYVTTKTPNPFALVHLKQEIEQALHRNVDIVRVRDKMNPFLKKRIEEEGIHV